jgi:hypothetical protein
MQFKVLLSQWAFELPQIGKSSAYTPRSCIKTVFTFVDNGLDAPSSEDLIKFLKGFKVLVKKENTAQNKAKPLCNERSQALENLLNWIQTGPLVFSGGSTSTVLPSNSHSVFEGRGL